MFVCHVLRSDGFIDRAQLRLKSFFISSAYIARNLLYVSMFFPGKKKHTRHGMEFLKQTLTRVTALSIMPVLKNRDHLMTNETDNYTQTHYQLFFNQHWLGKKINFNTALFLTKGKGYYEQYKADQAYADYGMPDPLFRCRYQYRSGKATLAR